MTKWRNADLRDIDLLDRDLDFIYTDIPIKHFVCFEDVLKMSSRQALEDEKLLRWRRVEDFLKTNLQDVIMTCWGPANVCWAKSDECCSKNIWEDLTIV